MAVKGIHAVRIVMLALWGILLWSMLLRTHLCTIIRKPCHICVFVIVTQMISKGKQLNLEVMSEAEDKKRESVTNCLRDLLGQAIRAILYIHNSQGINCDCSIDWLVTGTCN